jgi:hypothetical protein
MIAVQYVGPVENPLRTYPGETVEIQRARIVFARGRLEQ